MPNFRVLRANKFVGQSAPTLIVSYDLGTPTEWAGAWLLLADEDLKATYLSFFNYSSSKASLKLGDFFTEESFCQSIIESADARFANDLFTKNRDLHREVYCWGSRLEFSEVNDPLPFVVRTVFRASDGNLDQLKKFADICHSDELTEGIKLGQKLRSSVKIT